MDEKTIEQSRCIQHVLDVFPAPVFILEENLQVNYVNKAARELCAWNLEFDPTLKLCGEFLHCVHAMIAQGICGTTKDCNDCILRSALLMSIQGSPVVRKQAKTILMTPDGPVLKWFFVTAKKFEQESKTRVIVTLEDITELIERRTLLPICSYCKKVRDDNDYWQSLDNYITRYPGISLSHGICPVCMKKHHPDYLVE